MAIEEYGVRLDVTPYLSEEGLQKWLEKNSGKKIDIVINPQMDAKQLRTLLTKGLKDLKDSTSIRFTADVGMAETVLSKLEGFAKNAGGNVGENFATSLSDSIDAGLNKSFGKKGNAAKFKDIIMERLGLIGDFKSGDNMRKVAAEIEELTSIAKRGATIGRGGKVSYDLTDIKPAQLYEQAETLRLLALAQKELSNSNRAYIKNAISGANPYLSAANTPKGFFTQMAKRFENTDETNKMISFLKSRIAESQEKIQEIIDIAFSSPTIKVGKDWLGAEQLSQMYENAKVQVEDLTRKNEELLNRLDKMEDVGLALQRKRKDIAKLYQEEIGFKEANKSSGGRIVGTKFKSAVVDYLNMGGSLDDFEDERISKAFNRLSKPKDIANINSESLFKRFDKLRNQVSSLEGYNLLADEDIQRLEADTRELVDLYLELIKQRGELSKDNPWGLEEKHVKSILYSMREILTDPAYTDIAEGFNKSLNKLRNMGLGGGSDEAQFRSLLDSIVPGKSDLKDIQEFYKVYERISLIKGDLSSMSSEELGIDEASYEKMLFLINNINKETGKLQNIPQSISGDFGEFDSLLRKIVDINNALQNGDDISSDTYKGFLKSLGDFNGDINNYFEGDALKDFNEIIGFAQDAQAEAEELKEKINEVKSAAKSGGSGDGSGGIGIDPVKVEEIIKVISDLNTSIINISKAVGSVDDKSDIPDIINQFSELNKSISPIISKMEEFSSVVNGLGETTNKLQTMMQSINGVADKLQKSKDVSIAGLTPESIQEISLTFVGIKTTLEEIKRLIPEISKGAPSAAKSSTAANTTKQIEKGVKDASASTESFKGVIKELGRILGDLIKPVNEISRTLGTIGEKSKVPNIIKQFQTLSASITNMLTELQKVSDEMWNIDGLGVRLDSIKNSVKAISDALNKTADEGLENVDEGKLNTLKETLKEISEVEGKAKSGGKKEDITSINNTIVFYQKLANALKEYSVAINEIKKAADNNGTDKDTKSAFTDEVSGAERLKKTISDIANAVEGKTQAFKNEENVVTSVVDKEISKLNELEQKVRSVGDAANNPHLVTDEMGNVKTMYRGLQGMMGAGLVSGRYKGASFWTDNLELAKQYAEYTKVESANLAMNNPFEIDGNGAQWDAIKYLGTGADEASREIIELDEKITQLKLDLESLKVFENLSIVPPGIEEKVAKILSEINLAERRYQEISADTSNPYGTNKTAWYVDWAQNAGYDGVIFKNIIDSYEDDIQGLSNVMVVFEEQQAHFLETLSIPNNLTNENIKSIISQYQDIISLIQLNNGKATIEDKNILEKWERVLPVLKEYRNEIMDIYSLENDYSEEEISSKMATVTAEIQQKYVNSLQNATKAQKELNEEINQTPVLSGEEKHSAVTSETSEFDRLKETIATDIPKAVATKTEAFEQEKATVTAVIQDEIAELEKLRNAVSDVFKFDEGGNTLASELTKFLGDIDGQVPIITESIKPLKDILNGATSLDIKINVSGLKKLNITEENVEQVSMLSDIVKKLNKLNINEEFVSKLTNIRDGLTALKDVKDLKINDMGLKKIISLATPENIDNLSKLVSSINLINKAIQSLNNAESVANLIAGLKVSKANVNNMSDLATAFEMVAQSLDGFTSERLNALSSLNDVVSKLDGIKGLANILKAPKKVSEAIDNINKSKGIDTKKMAETSGSYDAIISKLQDMGVYEGEVEKRAIAIGEALNNVNSNTDLDKVKNDIKEFADEMGLVKTKSQQNYIEDAQVKLNGFRERMVDGLIPESGISKYEQELERYEAKLQEIRNLSNVELMSEQDIIALKTAKKELEEIEKVINKDRAFSSQNQTYVEKRISEILNFRNKNSAMGREYRNEINSIVSTLKTMGNASKEEIDKVYNRFLNLKNEIQDANKTGLSFADGLKKSFGSLWRYLGSFVSFYEVFGKIREGVETVKQYNDALKEMKKVTTDSYNTLKQFQKGSFDMASAVGTTAVDIQKATAQWLRLGENLTEAGKSAQESAKLYNISEFDSIEKAAEGLTSVSQAYSDVAKADIVDMLVGVGDSFPIAVNGLTEGLSRSAAALKQSGNDIQEAMALMVGAIIYGSVYGNIHVEYI